MKNRIIIYGEFLDDCSTGIAYVNSNLENSFNILGNQVYKIRDPRAKDYNPKIGNVKKNINLKSYLKIIFTLIFFKRVDLSILNLSMSNIGLIKTLIIQLFLWNKSKRVFLYIHRGDLEANLKYSFFKKFIFKIISKISFKIIFLSKKFLINSPYFLDKKKLIILPNSLSEKDCYLADQIFKERLERKITMKKKSINIIFSGNLQKQKGIHNIIEAVNYINKNQQSTKVYLDIYGIKFENIKIDENYIKYKGKLSTNSRLKSMAEYDLLIIASATEGLPITLLECLAIGLPFITTNVGAISDLLIQNYPYICNKDTRSIIQKIKKINFDILNNNEFIKNIIISNNKLFKEKFTSSKFLRNIEKLIY